jgi:energy-coupling factor transport system permease protein
VAWWLWAGSLAAAASRSTDPVLLGLIIVAAGVVVVTRRSSSPWATSYGMLLRLGAVVVAIRVLFQIVFGIRLPGHELFDLPSVALPSWFAGVELGGPVTLESVAGAACQGLRLAALLACIGAATALVSPYRLLRCVPSALYEVAVAVTVALSFTPAIVASVGRVRDAQRLRGRAVSGIAGIRGIAVPVLAGALERSIELAASMDSRGFGRIDPGVRHRHAKSMISLGGLVGLGIGTFGVLDGGAPTALGVPVLVLGGVLVVVGTLATSRGGRTRYRPDRFGGAEMATAAAGIAALTCLLVAGATDPSSIQQQVYPLALPPVPFLALAGIVLAALVPLWAAPPPAVASGLGSPGGSFPGGRPTEGLVAEAAA